MCEDATTRNQSRRLFFFKYFLVKYLRYLNQIKAGNERLGNIMIKYNKSLTAAWNSVVHLQQQKLIWNINELSNKKELIVGMCAEESLESNSLKIPWWITPPPPPPKKSCRSTGQSSIQNSLFSELTNWRRFHFYIPWKSLTFSRGTEMEHWVTIIYDEFYFLQNNPFERALLTL